MQTIGVIGAGLMGNGIAHVSALAGYDVILSDVEMARAKEQAEEKLRANHERNWPKRSSLPIAIAIRTDGDPGGGE